MFTGIVRDIGTVLKIEPTTDNYRLTVNHHLANVMLGDSISIDGTCLTVVKVESNSFVVEMMPETLKRTNLSELSVGQLVNLEPALRIGEKLSGHFVLGHVDTVGRLIKRQLNQNADILTFTISRPYRKYIVEKGSIAVNGVSLTVIRKTEHEFSVGIIPYTARETILGKLAENQSVNLETDILGKYIVDQFGGYKSVKA